MSEQKRRELAAALVEKILELGADVAGLAPVSALRNGPSERLFPRMKDHVRDYFADRVTTGLPHGAVKWQDGEETLLVFGISHPEERPELDWWVGESDPPGNRALADMAAAFKRFAEEEYPGLRVSLKPYHVEKGGVYLKDAAVAAGLGCIGRNNLLITPRFGPRIRLRAVGLNVLLPGSGLPEWDPCEGCAAPCRSACPRQAFDRTVYTREDGELLPGRDGGYSRLACAAEMEKNEQQPGETVRYCRACELACTAGGSGVYSDAFCKVYNEFGWNYFPEAFAEELLEWLRRSGISVKTALDLACGTGVLCECLSAAGIDASGMDFSQGMIDIARERNRSIRYDVADMITYRPERRFDLVTCTGDAINHIASLSDVGRIFDNVFACLVPGGYFVFDILSGREVPEEEPFELDFSEEIKARFLVEHDTGGRVHLKTTVYEAGKEPFTEEIVEKLHDVDRICALLRESGFDVVQRGDHLLLEEERHGASWVIAARRKAE